MIIQPKLILNRKYILTGCLFLAICTASALVNPALQPYHLIERHQNVIGGIITRVDDEKREVACKVTAVCMGQFAPREIIISAPAPEPGNEAEGDALFREAREGECFVAFVGKKRLRHEQDVLFYAGHQWHDAEILDLAHSGTWKWKEALGDEMHGTFDGAGDQLLAMLQDSAEARAFFPATPFVKFKPDRVIDTFAGSVRGVALYDIDGDGRLDIVAANEMGCRLYLQNAPGKFENRTAALGLESCRGMSVGMADANADGRPDLLVDGALWLQEEKGFTKSTLLPSEAGQRVKCSGFVEINGDGWPDVVVSRLGGGLAIYMNPGAKGAGFVDATAEAGLNRPETGSGLTGFFAPGDWNGDGRTDLFYAAGKGLWLVQDAKGRFAAIPHEVSFDLKANDSPEPGLTGAGCFASLWRPDSTDLVVAGDSSLMLVNNRQGTPRDVSGLGNESRQCKVAQLATLAEDLNMDGYVDLFTIARHADTKNIFHSNRGYGSYMVDDNYLDYDAFSGPAYETGAWGAAAGDVDGDGANDLLLGNVNGKLVLLYNDCLSLRQPKENPNYQEKVLLETGLLTVQVKGPVGVLGARVDLVDAKGRTVARRAIGTQVLTGCCGSRGVSLAVRQPGSYKLHVRFSDGLHKSWPVNLEARKHVVLTATR